ncbi:MAG: 3-hydroxyacyl-ACP dehydratase FabZ, partial [Pseudomonadota bacterium]
MSVDNARFRQPVVPGDTLVVPVTCQRHRGMVWKFDGQAKVDDKLVAEATFAAMILDS